MELFWFKDKIMQVNTIWKGEKKENIVLVIKTWD